MSVDTRTPAVSATPEVFEASPETNLDPIAERYARLMEGADEATVHRLQDELIAAMVPLADRLARRYSRRGESSEDLEQAARLALVNAVHRYDPARGSFTAFAVVTITGEIKRHFRDRAWAVRVPRRLRDLSHEVRQTRAELHLELRRPPTEREVAGRCDVEVTEIREASLAEAGYRAVSMNTPIVEGGIELGDLLGELDPAIDLVDDRITVEGLVRRLPARERHLLALRFQQDMTQSQIAEELGLSQMHVSRMLSRVLAWLRQGMLSDTVPPWFTTDRQPGDIRVTAHRSGTGAVRVQVTGEVDRDNAQTLRRHRFNGVHRERRSPTIALDLSGVPLMDAAGARALHVVSESARTRGIELRVVHVRPAVRHTLHICGLGPLLPSEARE
jgi:RNA polymerase sigma-B factor